MYKIFLLPAFMLILLADRSLLTTAQAWAGPPLLRNYPANCENLLDSVLSSSSWQSEWIDPILTDQAQLDQRLELAATLHSCLQGLSVRNEEQEALMMLSELFLVFAGGYQTPPGASTLELVDLAKSEDPAIQRLRRETGLAAPAGYVFVRMYSSRQAMPRLVGQVFADPLVGGATFLTRYIAILDEEKPGWAETALQARQLPRTTSHELVHAFANSALGAGKFDALPIWFQEGLAIYYSRSGESQAVVTPQLAIHTTSPAEYRQYGLNFEYLQRVLGRKWLQESIRTALQTGDASPLYTSLGLPSIAFLESAAREWQSRQTRNRVLIALGLFAAAFAWLYSLAPEVRCERCGHTGHRKDFPAGRCPECGQRNRLPRRVERLPLPTLSATCQVCGKRFWPWNITGLQRHPTLALAYMECERGAEYPHERRVRRICLDCLAKSAVLEAALHQRLEREQAAHRQAYSDWLAGAPLAWVVSAPDVELLTSEQALEELLDGTLDTGTGDLSPPSSYQDAFQQEVFFAGNPHKIFGSLFRTPDGRLAIVWRRE